MSTSNPQAIARSRTVLPFKSAAALAVAVVAILVIGLMAYQSLGARATAAEAMNHTTEVRNQTNLLSSALKDAETGQRGYLLTGIDRYLDPYMLAIGEIPGRLAQLRALTVDNPAQQSRLAQIEPLVKVKLDELADTIALRRAGNAAGATELVKSDRGQIAMAKLRDLLADMLTEEQRANDVRTAEWERMVSSSSSLMIGGAVVLLVVIFLVGVLASRDFRAVETEGWIRRVQLALGRDLAGDQRVDSIGDKVLRVLADTTRAHAGAVYLVEPGGRTVRVAARALPADAPKELGPGEGLVGEAARGGEIAVAHVTALPADYFRIASATGSTKPAEVVLVTAAIDGTAQAVIELGYLHAVDATDLEALRRAGEAIAIAVRGARDRRRLEELLEETQRQAEELQAQQEELRVSNEELEQQSRALQLSQVQLENQQAEVEQINVQLEEQAQSLERQRDDLARAGAELQRSNEYKSQFLANMSHELRTPLNSTLILAKLLSDNAKGNLDGEQVQFAQTIYSAGNDLLTLINDILDLSKIEAGMLDVRLEPIAVARLVDDLVATFQPVAAQKHLELAFTIEPGVPDAIETDSNRLRQILKNLLSNALKFTERGGVSLTVSHAAGRVRFAVRDTGIGIAADQLDLIFQPFKQADGAINRKFGGTGLGLSISRDLARLLGGDLSVSSEPGRGSVFAVEIAASPTTSVPARAPSPVRATPRVVVAPREETDDLAPSPVPDDRATLVAGSRSLLVIEDDLAFARVLVDLGRELEFAVITAATAEDGLALARRYTPSAIVLDVGLPDRSGLAVLDALKRDARTRHVPVHVVSATDHRRAAHELGAVGYALKPVERDKLVGAIKALETKFTPGVRRVLVVEDDPVLRDATARLLAGEDVETLTCGTTARALEILGSTTVDCMVLDLTLPDRSGLELLEEMARGERYSFPPVIVYTGRSLAAPEVQRLEQLSSSIIIKGARSPERLLDEVTLFLHQVESKLPPERQRMLRDVRDRELVFEGKRILVVEDDVRNVFALSAILEPKGARVEIARNGKDALAHLAAKPGVDLVLMDIMMPEMDGLEATRRIRAQPALANLPIVALTAKAMTDDRDRCLAAGANDYIAKPLDVDKFISLARIWIRK